MIFKRRYPKAGRPIRTRRRTRPRKIKGSRVDCDRSIRMVNRTDKMGRLRKLLSPSLLDHDLRPQPKGIKRFRNTCFLNSAVILMKNIPGLVFKGEEFGNLYKTPPGDVSEEMGKRAVEKCPGMRYGRPEDSMELIMNMTEDVENKELFSVNWGDKFYLDRKGRRLPLLSDISEEVKARPMQPSGSIRIYDIEPKRYSGVQELFDLVKIENQGISIDYSDRSEFSVRDFVEEEGERMNLEDIHGECGGSWKFPSCTKPYYSPDAPYLIVYIDSVNLREKRKTEAEIENVLEPITFSSGAYSPISFVTHIGGLDYGHYINYSLVDGVWYEFNDQTVQPMGRHHGTVSYLLYRRF